MTDVAFIEAPPVALHGCLLALPERFEPGRGARRPDFELERTLLAVRDLDEVISHDFLPGSLSLGATSSSPGAPAPGGATDRCRPRGCAKSDVEFPGRIRDFLAGSRGDWLSRS